MNWRDTYELKRAAARSWSEDFPATSLQFTLDCSLPFDAAVLDVGGGAAKFVDALLDVGYRDVTVLDLAASALAETGARLAARHRRAHLLEGDVRTWVPPRTYDLWHDRAALHFLTEPGDLEAYYQTLLAATGPGSWLVLATFALDGPDMCSGLPVRRWSNHELEIFLGDAFITHERAHLVHTTPWASTQAFTWHVARRR
jgi:trans-aconitate methyltransferase